MNTSSRRMMRQDKRDNNKIALITIILYLIGVVFVLSASSAGLIMNGNKDVTSFMEKQVLFGVIAITLGFIASRINPKLFIKHQKEIFYFTLFILAVVLLIAPEIKGSRSWLKIGSFSIQPAEFAKLTLILMASSVLKHKNVNTTEMYKQLCLYTLPILILVVMQGDLGTVMIMGAILLAMMYLGGIRKIILGGITLAGVVAVLILSIISPYRMKRMLIFLNPESDYYGMGYQIIQSLYSIANGGLLGQGLGNSIHKYGYLPENHTDFIFAILTEEIGFIGATLVILLFILLITHIFKVAFKVQNKQLSLICAGIGSFIAIESLLNLSVVVSLMPVTGVTLPFLSYGGSSLISKFLCIGLVLGINRTSKKTEAKQLDEERITQAKERQKSRMQSLEKVNNFRKTADVNIHNAIQNVAEKVATGYRAVIKANKENFNKVTSRKIGKESNFAKTKKKFSNASNNSLKLRRKDAPVFKTTKKTAKSALNNKKQSQFNTINLDETYLDQSGFNNTFDDLTEIDLGSIDIKKFNQNN